jgi:hypothetical protein
VLVLRGEQRQGEAGGGGTEQVRVEVGVANSEQRRGGNGLVRLELRGVAAGLPVEAWQLASEGVHARECARTHGCKQMHPVSSNDQTMAHHAAGTPSCERRSTVGNGLPSGGLAARQDLGRHGGKQGKRDSAAEVPNAGEVSRVRAHGRVCVSAWARSSG